MADTPTKRRFVPWIKRIAYKALRAGFITSLATVTADLSATLTDNDPILGEPGAHMIVVGIVALVNVLDSELARNRT